jgi:hypothetical protein
VTRTAHSSLSFGDAALLLLLLVLAVAALIVRPMACVWIVSPFAGIAVLIWLWGWRRPGLRLRLRRLTREVNLAAANRVPVQRTYWFGEPSINKVAVFVQVATDAQRDDLLAHGLRKDFERLRERSDLLDHVVRLEVQSEETVMRDYGSWHGYFQ